MRVCVFYPPSHLFLINYIDIIYENCSARQLITIFIEICNFMHLRMHTEYMHLDEGLKYGQFRPNLILHNIMAYLEG